MKLKLFQTLHGGHARNGVCPRCVFLHVKYNQNLILRIFQKNIIIAKYDLISKSPGECDHVWASVRDVGTEIIWEGCDMTDEEDAIIDDEGVECNLLENEKELKCKLYPDEKGISMLFFKCLQHIVLI